MVSVKDVERTASAPRLVYRTESGDITLSAEGTSTTARVDDARGSVQARIIHILGQGDDVVAETDVRSVLQGGSEGATRPGMFKADEPVNVTAGKLERRTKKAVYTGDAQIWQGATSIKGETITLDEDSGNLLAAGKVRTVMELEEQDAATGATRRNVTTGTASELEYQEKERKAVLRTTARLVSVRDGDLRGNRLEMFLLEGGRELERLEAYEAVTLQMSTPTCHRGTSDVLHQGGALRDGGDARGGPGAVPERMSRDDRPAPDVLSHCPTSSRWMATSPRVPRAAPPARARP